MSHEEPPAYESQSSDDGRTGPFGALPPMPDSAYAPDAVPLEPLFADDPTQWTVHVLGPDDVLHFATADEAASWLGGAVSSWATMFPRRSEYDPMLRLVVSPPTAVEVVSGE